MVPIRVELAGHRFLGRLIGLAFALPLAWFWIKKQIPQGQKLKLFGLFLLGGAQGFMGWYMVKSGLIDNPEVSHYRLAAHLSLAFIIFAAMLWMGLHFLGIKKAPSTRLFKFSALAFTAVCLTIIWGAFVAGLNAGLIYNDTFPLMGGCIFPPDMWHLTPAWINILENHEAVQFTHRWLAMLSAAFILFLWFQAKKEKQTPRIFHAAAIMVIIQAGLGISTLFSGVALPLAALHQASGLTLFGILIGCLYTVKPKQR